MLIAETYVSLQGEGILAGTPSFLIRTSGCNLRCRWCDTPYASWFPMGRRRRVPELVEEARQAGPHHVVLTGGEPLLQREAGELTRALRSAGFHLTVETSGTVSPEFECDLLSVSPKTSSSDPEGPWRERHRATRQNVAPLIDLLARFPAFQLKFVIDSERDLPEIVHLLHRLGDPDPGRVLLMPQGRTPQEAARRAPMVAALCLEHGFRYTPRLQLDLFGGGRGV